MTTAFLDFKAIQLNKPSQPDDKSQKCDASSTYSWVTQPALVCMRSASISQLLYNNNLSAQGNTQHSHALLLAPSTGRFSSYLQSWKGKAEGRLRHVGYQF